MKKKFKATLAVAAIVAVCIGSVKTYQSYSVSNQMGEDNMLLAENVMSYSDAPGIPWGRVCKWAGALFVCVDALGNVIDNAIYVHYHVEKEDCIAGYDKDYKPIPGKRDVAVQQQGSGENECRSDYRGICKAI